MPGAVCGLPDPRARGRPPVTALSCSPEPGAVAALAQQAAQAPGRQGCGSPGPAQGCGSPGPSRPVGGRPRVPRSSPAGRCGAGWLPRDVLPRGGQGSGAVGPLAVAVPPLAPGRGPETRRPAPRPPAGSVSQSWVSLHTDRLSTRGQSLVQHRNLRRVTFDHGAVPHSVVSRWLVEGPRSRRAVSG